MDTGIPTQCESPTRRRSTLSGLRHWYGRWVKLREARYQYLAAILDGDPSPDALVPRAERVSISPGDQP